ERFGLDVSLVYRDALKGYAASMTPTTAASLEGLGNVAWVERDKVMRVAAQNLPTGVNRAEADLSPTAAIDGADTRVDVDVAVIDTGVNLSHPDLNVNAAGAKNCTNPLTSVEDLNGHGTHVSGTIGALDNTSGVAGMAPGARIWPVKVLTDVGVGLNSQVICGIDYVAAHAAEIEVANMSLGGAGEDDGNCGETSGDAEHAAICSAVAAGITFVVAAGNDSADAKDSSPAAYDEVITVSALSDFDGAPGGAGSPTCRDDQDDTFADYSNFGSDVDIIAPGTCIESTWMAGGYDTISGTSMASPHVAGAAALYASRNPSATPDQVKSALQSAASLDWDNSDDGDSTKERLLNATTF
ncbi:MAG: S8 family serine peptidase, partial [Actinomycetota bacterium]